MAGQPDGHIFRSPFPDVAIPSIPLTDLVLHQATALKDKPAFIDGPSGRTLTFGQVAAGVRRMAAGLSRRGFGKGDVLALWSPNLPEFAVAFHAVALLGGIVTTANPLNTAEEFARQLRDSGATLVVTIPALLPKAREAATDTRVRELFVFGEAEGATPVSALLAETGDPPSVAIDPAVDVVALPYSSGTTGLPKGVMLTHRNLTANLLQTEAVERLPEDDVLIAVLPYYHIYGMTVVLNLGLYSGATQIVLPRFDLESFLGLMQRYAVTNACLVPPIVLALAKHPAVDQFDLSKLRVITSGAAPLSAELSIACEQRLGCVVKQGYGMTELSPVTHITPEARNRPGSIGLLIPNTECLVADLSTGAALPPGEAGEIWIRGPQVMKGYLNDAAATAHTIDSEGWLHTGDIGSGDADGYFRIVDRLKELIKFKGYQVPPAELEAVLLTHPRVADAAVIGIPDEEAGEVPKAFVVRRDDCSADELMAYVAERVSPYKRIRQLEFLESIPKSSSGKILRIALIERERQAAHS